MSAPNSSSPSTAAAATKTSNTSPASASSSTPSVPISTKDAAAAESTPLIKRPNPTPSTSAKKRPYRRTKRPKNYNDKSTVTTTTEAVHTPVNVYDAVLGECEDLLKASMEAQSLGRLKMASAYQLLLHTRLIGLGKRFDRAQTLAPTPKRTRRGDTDSRALSEDNPNGNEEDSRFPTSRLNYDDCKPTAEAGGKGGDDAASNGSGTPRTPGAAARSGSSKAPSSNHLPRALQQLTSILPSNLEMDTTMMEHLARAAVELHHQRTGRKKSADGLLASPMTGGGFPATPQPSESTTPKGGAGSKLAWTAEEQKTVTKAMQQKKSASAIAKLLPSKTEAQVKAFLKNRKVKDSVQDAYFEGDDVDETPSKRKGGRGRKPPTTAMNTVPNANLDMKALLQGHGLQTGQASGATQSSEDVVIL